MDDKEATSSFLFRSFEGILPKLFNAFVDEQKRYEALPTEFPSTSKEELLKKVLPSPVEAFYVKSIDMLNEIGKACSTQSEKEKLLCKKLVEYNKFSFGVDLFEEDNRIELKIKKPIKQFIDKYYEDILAINKQNIAECNFCDILRNPNLSQKNKTNLESFQKLFEEGAYKYPRLIHLVLEWPLFSCMPKPPREILQYCDPREYDWMLKGRKGNFIRYSNFSTIETQSAQWLLYPKGESWNKDSGKKRFLDLSNDLSKLLGCNWLRLLHDYAKMMSSWPVHYDGWDGLFDDDYELDEEYYKKGLYKDYYITDVFYESIRLCRKLLDSETGAAEQMGTEKPEKAIPEEYELMEELAEEIKRWAAESEFKDIKKEEQFRNDYVEKPYQENYYKFLTRQIKLISIIGKDELNRLIERIKWRKPEMGKALDEQRKKIHSKIDPIFQSSLNGSNDKLIIASVLIDGYAEEFAKSLLNIALIMRQESQADKANLAGTKRAILQLIEDGEGHTIEFKETLEYDVKTNKNNKDVLLSSLKTVAGFLNANGGTLLIGVNDYREVKGIERDLGTMRHSNNDRFEQRIRNCLRDRFSPQPIGKVDISFEKFTEGTICRVDVPASKEIVHLDDDVYVRDGNTTRKLEGRELTDWIQQRGK